MDLTDSSKCQLCSQSLPQSNIWTWLSSFAQTYWSVLTPLCSCWLFKIKVNELFPLSQNAGPLFSLVQGPFCLLSAEEFNNAIGLHLSSWLSVLFDILRITWAWSYAFSSNLLIPSSALITTNVLINATGFNMKTKWEHKPLLNDLWLDIFQAQRKEKI